MKVYFTLIQTDLYWENTQANLKMFNNLLENIPPESEIVILPEMFSTGFTMNVKKLEKPIGKKAFEWLRKKAKELNKIIIGSILFEEIKLTLNNFSDNLYKLYAEILDFSFNLNFLFGNKST